MAPVRASVVKIPKEYRFSSYLYNTQGKEVGVKITQHESYKVLTPWNLDKSDEETQQKYKQLLREQQSEEDLQEMYRVTNGDLIFGSKQFRELVMNNGV
jgi:hypothetical protein